MRAPRRIVSLLAVAGMLVLAPVAVIEAAPVTVHFTGTLDLMPFAGLGDFEIGDLLTGSFTYDTSGVDTEPGDITLGSYSSLTALSFSVGSYAGELGVSPFHSLIIRDIPANDTFHVSAGALVGAPVQGSLPVQFRIDLTDHNPTPSSAFTGDGLPETFPVCCYEFREWGLTFQSPAGAFVTVGGKITSLRTEQLPEPVTSSLFAIGLAGLAVRRLRRRSA